MRASDQYCAPGAGVTWRLRGDVLRDGAIAHGEVAVDDAGRIAGDSGPARRTVVLPPGWVVAPGLVDLQVNGYAGHEIGPDPGANAAVARALPATGVTAFCPTLVTRDAAGYAACARGLQATEWPADGARPLGVHLEGPFLSPARAGAHRAHLFANPGRDAVAALLALLRPRIVTLAPELPGGLRAVAQVAAAGAVPALGHTEADATTARRALHAGARLLTHAFNAMPGIAHHHPGVLAALLADPRAHISLIGDGVHVAPAVAAIAARAAGRRLVLVSDAVSAAGASPGRHALSGRDVTSDGRRATTADGRLAGAVRGLDAGVATLAAAGVDRAAALDAACAAPRRLLGLPDGLSPGTPADLVLLDAGLRVRATVRDGRAVHATAGAPALP